MRACSASMTSMITPPLSILAIPILTSAVPVVARGWFCSFCALALAHGCVFALCSADCALTATVLERLVSLRWPRPSGRTQPESTS